MLIIRNLDLISGLNGLKVKLNFSILNHSGSFMVHYYLFDVFYLCKVLFSVFFQFKANFVDG